MMFKIFHIDHVQISMPNGGLNQAKSFFINFLGMQEIPNPGSLGGLWVKTNEVNIHIATDENFRRLHKTHIAFVLNDINILIERCKSFSIEIEKKINNDFIKKIYILDPFGNRLEFIEYLV